MKFFDLELGGLGSMPNRVIKEQPNGVVYLGGTTEEQCKLSDQEWGRGFKTYSTKNCTKENAFVYVAPEGCKCKIN
jgi:hypothetical protein